MSASQECEYLSGPKLYTETSLQLCAFSVIPLLVPFGKPGTPSEPACPGFEVRSEYTQIRSTYRAIDVTLWKCIMNPDGPPGCPKPTMLGGDGLTSPKTELISSDTPSRSS
jgi:hypothetical protein